MICPHCNSQSVTSAKRQNSNTALVLVLVGLFLSPWMIGIPALLVGIVMSAKRIPANRYVCKVCRTEFDFEPVKK